MKFFLGGPSQKSSSVVSSRQTQGDLHTTFTNLPGTTG